MNPSENNSNDHAESSYPATSPKQQRIYNIRNAAIEAEVAEEVRLMVANLRSLNTIRTLTVPDQKSFVYVA